MTFLLLMDHGFLVAFSWLFINIMSISTRGSIFGSLIFGHYIQNLHSSHDMLMTTPMDSFIPSDFTDLHGTLGFFGWAGSVCFIKILLSGSYHFTRPTRIHLAGVRGSILSSIQQLPLLCSVRQMLVCYAPKRILIFMRREADAYLWRSEADAICYALRWMLFLLIYEANACCLCSSKQILIYFAKQIFIYYTPQGGCIFPMSTKWVFIMVHDGCLFLMAVKRTLIYYHNLWSRSLFIALREADAYSSYFATLIFIIMLRRMDSHYAPRGRSLFILEANVCPFLLKPYQALLPSYISESCIPYKYHFTYICTLRDAKPCSL